MVEKNTYADKQKKKITFVSNSLMWPRSRGKVVVYPMNTNNVTLSCDVLQSRNTAHKGVGEVGGVGVGLQIHPLLAVVTFAISFTRYVFPCSTLGKNKAQAS